MQYKKGNKQVNRQQQHYKDNVKQINNNKQLLYIYTGKDILLQVHLSDCFPCDIKGKTEQSTGIQKEFSQSCVKARYGEGNNCGLKISVIKLYLSKNYNN